MPAAKRSIKAFEEKYQLIFTKSNGVILKSTFLKFRYNCSLCSLIVLLSFVPAKAVEKQKIHLKQQKKIKKVQLFSLFNRDTPFAVWNRVVPNFCFLLFLVENGAISCT